MKYGEKYGDAEDSVGNSHGASNNDPFGGFSGNGFTNVFAVASNAYAGAVTNFHDAGAVTNSQARYYRVKLVR